MENRPSVPCDDRGAARRACIVHQGGATLYRRLTDAATKPMMRPCATDDAHGATFARRRAARRPTAKIAVWANICITPVSTAAGRHVT
ncbi:hypothetical protein D3260_16615 [Salinisphaera sp. Q1T1-3]|nr:hypothetical protein D3260_16615 [Salinisphaera sp. Q1T1-3]